MALFHRPSTARHRATAPREDAAPAPARPPVPATTAKSEAAAPHGLSLLADPAQGTRTAQTTAITALTHLHTEDAPTIQWTLTDDAQVPPRLEGLIHPRTTDPDRYQRTAVAAWQRVIGAGPVTVDPARGGGERLTITGSYRGVAVIVGTTIRGQR